ncbi:MAG: YncE family protein [Acidimicrobiia bacterium]
MRSRILVSSILVVAVFAPAACSSSGSGKPAVGSTKVTSARAAAAPTRPGAAVDVYAHTHTGDMSPAVAGVPTRVYVPNSQADTVDVIDPATYKVVGHYAVGRLPQHVVPAWDLHTLYVNDNRGNTLTPIDPKTGKPGPPIPVDDPYNLYFTPDGTTAIVMTERNNSLDFRDPHTWKVLKHLPVPPCRGPNHLDFSADGRTAVFGCEFNGWLMELDVVDRAITHKLHVGGMPIDVKLAPDGTVFFVANQGRDGVSVIDPSSFTEVGFIPTGKGTHGLYPSRDGTKLYASNRAGGSVSVIDFATRKVLVTWKVGGSPDMGGVSADGRELWLSNRYNASVSVIDTATGKVTHVVEVGAGAHGLCLFPQPGRFSMGHTGNYR